MVDEEKLTGKIDTASFLYRLKIIQANVEQV